VQIELMTKDARAHASTEGWGFARWRGEALVPHGGLPCRRPRARHVERAGGPRTVRRANSGRATLDRGREVLRRGRRNCGGRVRVVRRHLGKAHHARRCIRGRAPDSGGRRGSVLSMRWAPRGRHGSSPRRRRDAWNGDPDHRVPRDELRQLFLGPALGARGPQRHHEVAHVRGAVVDPYGHVVR
jgi:hypothetical protein